MFHLTAIDAQMHFDVVHRKKSSAGGVDDWCLKEFKIHPFLGLTVLQLSSIGLRRIVYGLRDYLMFTLQI